MAIRVAQMMTEMNYGGVEMVVFNYYRHIDRTKVQFDFFVLEGSLLPKKDEIEKMGGRIYIVPKYTHLLRYMTIVKKILKQNQYRIVHSHMNTLSVFSLCAAQLAGIPNRIAHNHSTASKGETKKNILKYMLRPFAKVFPTKLFACSNHAGEWLFGKKSNFTVWHNAIDINSFKYDEEIRNKARNDLKLNDKFVIGNVGRLCYQKNQERVIDIFHAVCKRIENAVLLLVGDGGTSEQLKKKVKDYDIEDKVYFLGNRDDVNRLYQAMDVLLFPSRYEGLGMAAIEAQAAALQVIASTNVPEETKLSEYIEYVDLEQADEVWAERIVQHQEYVRKDMRGIMESCGYSIEKEAGKLAEEYLNMLE